MKTRKTLFTWLLTAFVFSLFSLWGTTLRSENVVYNFCMDKQSSTYEQKSFTTEGVTWTASYGSVNLTGGPDGCANTLRFGSNGSKGWAELASPYNTALTAANSCILYPDKAIENVGTISFSLASSNADSPKVYLLASPDNVAYSKVDSVSVSGNGTAYTLSYTPGYSSGYFVLVITNSSAAKANVGVSSATVVTKGTGKLPIATPTFTKATDSYYDSVLLTLSCDTPGTKIYYTLDGNTPTALSAEYSSPIWIKESKTVKAIATKDEEHDTSSVATAEYTIVNLTGRALNAGAFSGGYSDLTIDAGFHHNISSDYSNEPKLKFDAAGKFVVMKIAENADTLAFDIKGNSLSGEYRFVVEGSRNGSDWEDLIVYTNNTFSSVTSVVFALNNDTADMHYFRWREVAKGSGNFALGGMNVYKAIIPDPEVIIASDSTLAPMWSEGSVDVEMEVLGENLTEDLSILVQGRGFTVSPETLTQTAGSASGNVTVTYTYQATPGKDTARVIAKHGDFADTAYIYAESKVCSEPVVDAITDLTEETAKVPFSGSDTLVYQYKIKESEDAWSEEAGKRGSPIQLSGLTAGTAYWIRVKNICAKDVNSGYDTASFTTAAAGAKTISFDASFTEGKKFTGEISIGFTTSATVTLSESEDFIKVTLNKTDPASVVKTDTLRADGPYTQWLESGNYTIKMELIDNTGEVQNTAGPQAFSVDLPNVRKITFDPESSIYDEAQSVSITCATDGAAIQYRIGESGDWKDYSTAVAVDSNLTLFAKASKEHMDDTIDKAVYELMVKDVEFLTDGSVEYKNVVGVKLQCATTGAQIYYTIDDSDPATNGQLYADSIKLTANARVKAVAKKQGWTNSTLKDSAYRVVEVIKVEGALVFEENFSKCNEAWGSSSEKSSNLDPYTDMSGWTGSSVYPVKGTVKMGGASTQGYLTSPAIDLSHNNGTYYVSFKAAAWKGDANSIRLVTASDTADIENLDNSVMNGSVSDDAAAAAFKDYVVKFTHGETNTKLKFMAKTAKNNRFYIDEVKVYQELPAFVKLGADATLDGIVSGTKQGSLTIEGNKLEDAITITTPRNDRNAFSVTPLSVAAAEANKVNTLSVTYTAQTVAGRDTLMVVAACGEAKDTAYVYAQTLPCGKAGNVEQDLNVTTAQFTVAGVDSVRYQYKQKVAAAWSTEANTTNDLITLSGLTAETTYQLRLRRICAAGYYSEYDTVEFTTLSATAKNVTLVQPTKDQVFTDSVLVKFSPANFKMADSGIARVTFSNRDTLYVASDTACKHLLQSGNYTVKVELLTKDRNVFTPAVSAGPVSFKVQLPKAAKPTFTPTNQTVAGGDSTFYDSVYVSMATTTPNATIKYKLNTANWRNYTEPILLEVGTQTLRAYAKAANTDNSDTLEMTYTIERTPGEEITFTKVTDAAEFLDGDKVIIVNGDKGLAMSSKVNSSKLLGTAVTINGNNILTEIATETEQQLPAQFVLVANPEGEGFAFQFGGKYLKGETGSTNCQFADAPSYYTISADESGNMNIVYNVSGGRMIRGYNSDFRQYVVKDNPDGQAVQIYLSEHGTASTDPSLTAAASVNISYNEGENGTAKIVVRGKNLEQAVTVAVKDSKAGFAVSPASLTAANVMRSVGDTVTVTYSGSKLKDTADITLSCGELVKTVKAYVSKNVPTVEAVTFTPAAGTYIDSVWVKMSCATAGASIRYTLDGKEPDETSLLFADSIKLTQTVTVKARGFMAEMNDGPVATAKYTIRSSSAPATGDTYNKVYDVAELTNGSKVLIVNEEFNTAASYPNALSGNTYLKYAEVEAGADLMTAEAATEKAENKPYEITIRKHSEGTGFVLYDSIYQRYYTHTKGGKNTVSLDSLEPADYWTIEISDEGVAQLVPSCETNYRMQYNSNSGQERFSCYTGSQKEVALYKREGSGEEPAPVTEPTLTVNRSTLSLSYIKGEEASAEFTVKGRLLTDTVKISVNGTGFSVQPSWIKDSVAMASPVTVTLKYDGSKEIDSAVITVASTGAESVTIKVKAKAIPTYASLEELYEAEVVATQTYVMTGKVVVTNKDSKSNRIWVQDKGMDENFGASILVYQAGNYGYDSLKIGDVITGLTGKLSLYHGLLELTPTEKMRASEHNQNIYVSNLNIPTLKQYAAEYYQSALVRLSDVKFVDAEGNFEGGQSAKNYTLEDASGNRIIFRTDYKDADYLGSAVPTEKFTLTAIVAVYDTTVQITARSLADFDGIPTGIANAKDVRFAVYPNPNTGKFFVTLEEEAVVEVYNAAGVCMMRHRANSGVKEISLKAAGIYFVKVICGERSAVKRVIVR